MIGVRPWTAPDTDPYARYVLRVDSESTLFQRVGGAAFFERLVDAFYERVAGDEALAALYPEAPNFEGATHRLSLFLIQYWGGPPAYSQQRGHPRLRMRHFPFPIGPEERDRWLAHMQAAVDRVTEHLDDGPRIASELMNYFTPAANQLRNDTLTIKNL